MVQLPALTQIASTIKQGSVYLIEQTHFNTDTPHFFVILNKSPLDSTTLVVVNATSNVQGIKDFITKRKLPVETLVESDQRLCSFLKHRSAFNCNSPHVYTPQDLIERCQNGVFRYKDEIDQRLLNELIAGVKASPLVSKITKQAIDN